MVKADTSSSLCCVVAFFFGYCPSPLVYMLLTVGFEHAIDAYNDQKTAGRNNLYGINVCVLRILCICCDGENAVA